MAEVVPPFLRDKGVIAAAPTSNGWWGGPGLARCSGVCVCVEASTVLRVDDQ